MKTKILLIAALQFFALGSLCAQSRLVDNDKAFNSVFGNLVSGKFSATANGLLCFKTFDGKDVLLDFQGSEAGLTLEADPDEVYDVSRKKYTALTTSGRTKIEYTTYASANDLTIRYQNQDFSIGGIDGACDMVIDGLSYTYWAEAGAEYLVLTVTQEITLTNRDRKETERELAIKLQPNSTIVFAVKR